MSPAMQANFPVANLHRFFLIDPTLRDAAGHNLDYSRIVTAEARAAGFDCRVFAHAAATIGSTELGCAVEPWFSRGHKDLGISGAFANQLRRSIGPRAVSLARRVKRSLTRIQDPPTAEQELARADPFAEEVSDLLMRFAPVTGDRLFFPNALWNEAVRIVQTIQAAGIESVTETQILLRFDPPQLHGAAALLSRVGQAKGVKWLADTEELAQAYGALLQSHVSRVRVPFEGDAIRKAATTRPKPDPVTVLAIGESRREKGFHLLPQIIERMLAIDPDIEYRVQLSQNVPGGEPGISEAMSRLQRLEGRNLKLLPAKISSATFTEILGEAHVLLLPYDALSYSRRSSGLLLHGLAAGMVIAMPKGAAALARCLAYNGRALQAVLCDGSIDGYVSAVIDAAHRVRFGAMPSLERLPEEELPAPWTDPI